MQYFGFISGSQVELNDLQASVLVRTKNNWNKASVIAFVAFLLLGCHANTSTWAPLGVETDKVGITKTLISDGPFPGSIQSIQLGNFDGDAELELAVVPQTGIYLFNAGSFEKKTRLDFKRAEGEPIWFGLSPYLIQDKQGFSIAKQGQGYGDTALLDQSGRELWNFQPGPLSPNGMVVDDLPSQQPRFYVADRSAIFRLDANGGVVWKLAEDANYIALMRDQDGAEADFATAGNRSRTLKVWSPDGKALEQFELPFQPDGLAFVRAGQTSGFVIKSGTNLAFLDRSGKHRFTFAYRVPVYHGPQAALVRLTAGQPPLLAIRSASRSATGKSVLTLLSLDGALLYQEYLGSGSALGIVPVKGEARDKLIVGEDIDKLWAYEKVSANN